MNWLNLPALLGVVAVGIPVLIHLLGRRQARQQRFPTLRFLDQSRVLPTRRTRLTDLLLLIVRAAAVAVAALALAQPLVHTPNRTAALKNIVGRAIVVDTSASMLRLAVGGGVPRRMLDAARDTAARLAGAATTSLVIEAAEPANAIPGALDWLRRQSGRAELVIVSDFQAGTIDSTALARVPPDIGIALAAVDARADATPPAVTVRGATAVTTAQLSLTPDRTTVEWTRTPVAAIRDSGARYPLVLVGNGDRGAADAAQRAAAAMGGSWTSRGDRPVVVVYPGAAERAQLSASAHTLSTPWMADAVARMDQDSALDRAGARAAAGVVGGRESLLLFPTVGAGTLASAILIRAAAAAVDAPPPVTELDPSTLAPPQLRRWERLAAPTLRVDRGAPPGEADGRWLWLAALALLGAEGWMRRGRPSAAVDQRGSAEHARDRAA